MSLAPYTPIQHARIAGHRCTALVILAATTAMITSACGDAPTSTSSALGVPSPSASIAALTGVKQPHYTVVDLGTFGGSSSIAFDVNDAGRVVGSATVPGGYQHAFRWRRGRMTDLGTLGGLNSQAGGRDARAELAVVSDTRDADPLGENFCGLNSGLICRAAIWRNGGLTELPTLGGTNSSATAINNRGELIGASEDGTSDATCQPPQKTHFQAAVWGPKPREIHKLRPLPGDEVGLALKINDKGQVVGASGLCSNTSFGAFALGPHAVLWDHGSPTDLGNLGDPNNVNVAADVNNRGEVVGGASFPGGGVHPFMWTKATGMRDLGLMSANPADATNTPFAINDNGQMVGQSCDNTFFTCRAYIWQAGVFTDLNDLIPADSPLYLVGPFGINSHGDISGLALVKSTGEAHAFLAMRTSGKAGEDGSEARRASQRMALSYNVRKLLLHKSKTGDRDPR